MTLNYTLSEDDFTYAYMYSVNHKKSAQSMRQVIRVLYPGIFLFLAVQNRAIYPIALFFIVVSILSFIFFNKIFAWRLKSKCKRILRKQPQSYVGQPIALKLTNKDLLIKDLSGERCLNHNQIINITEVESYFIINLVNGISMPIPKHFTSPEEVRTFLETIDLPFVQNLDYK